MPLGKREDTNLKHEALDPSLLKTCFGTSYDPVARSRSNKQKLKQIPISIKQAENICLLGLHGSQCTSFQVILLSDFKQWR